MVCMLCVCVCVYVYVCMYGMWYACALWQHTLHMAFEDTQTYVIHPTVLQSYTVAPLYKGHSG